MFKRLLLMGLLAIVLVVPAFAAGVVVAESESEAICNVDTLGTSENGVTVTFRALWSPKTYSCGAGFYLNPENGACASCLSDNYCPGFSFFSFDGSAHGLQACPENFPNSEALSTAESNCFKIDNVVCSEKNPYTYGHGVAVYKGGETSPCKQYSGGESCNLIDTTACDIDYLVCADGYTEEIVEGSKRCITTKVHCEPGEYLPVGSESPAKCPENYYCTGGDYDKGLAEDAGATKCPSGLKSPVGAQLYADCGHILHVGDDKLYLHSDKNTQPSLVVQIDGQKWYADMTPVSEGKKPISTDPESKTMHMTVDNVDYTVHGRYTDFIE